MLLYVWLAGKVPDVYIDDEDDDDILVIGESIGPIGGWVPLAEL